MVLVLLAVKLLLRWSPQDYRDAIDDARALLIHLCTAAATALGISDRNVNSDLFVRAMRFLV